MEARLYMYFPCQIFYAAEEIRIDDSKQICYGIERGYWPAGTCDGDFGGPVVHKDVSSDQAICLIGIASFTSDSRIDSMVPSVFTCALYFGPWIVETIEALSVKSS